MCNFFEEDRIRTCDEGSSTDLQSTAFNQTQPPLRLGSVSRFKVTFEHRFSESMPLPVKRCRGCLKKVYSKKLFKKNYGRSPKKILQVRILQKETN